MINIGNTIKQLIRLNYDKIIDAISPGVVKRGDLIFKYPDIIDSKKNSICKFKKSPKIKVFVTLSKIC
jgi:hypothetical protein